MYKELSVYANTTDKYAVVDPKGTIAAHSYVDLLVRHNAPFQSNSHSRDKFMVTMQDAATSQVSLRDFILNFVK